MYKFICVSNIGEMRYLTFMWSFYDRIANSLLISSHDNDENLGIEQKMIWKF